MKGTQEDWEKLIEKLESLEKILLPVTEDIELTEWFRSTKITMGKLLNTFQRVVETHSKLESGVWLR